MLQFIGEYEVAVDATLVGIDYVTVQGNTATVHLQPGSLHKGDLVQLSWDGLPAGGSLNSGSSSPFSAT